MVAVTFTLGVSIVTVDETSAVPSPATVANELGLIERIFTDVFTEICANYRVSRHPMGSVQIRADLAVFRHLFFNFFNSAWLLCQHTF